MRVGAGPAGGGSSMQRGRGHVPRPTPPGSTAGTTPAATALTTPSTVSGTDTTGGGASGSASTAAQTGASVTPPAGAGTAQPGSAAVAPQQPQNTLSELPTALSAGGTSATSTPGGGGKTLADCMAIWAPDTHMTKVEWRDTCKRTLNGIEMPTETASAGTSATHTAAKPHGKRANRLARHARGSAATGAAAGTGGSARQAN